MHQQAARRINTALCLLAALTITVCSACSDATDDDAGVSTRSIASRSTSSTAAVTTTSALPPCSDVDRTFSYLTPARWLPAEVPDNWQLDSAATLEPIAGTTRTGASEFIEVRDRTVVGVLAIGTGSKTLAAPEPVTVRGTAGQWGWVGGRSIEAATDPYLTWREGGVERWVAALDMDRDEVVDALAPVELIDDPIRLVDPTGRLVPVAERPPSAGSVFTVLTYRAPGGTSQMVDSDPGDASPDRVTVLIEQFGNGGTGILASEVGFLSDVVDWQLDTSAARPVLRTPEAAAVPVVSGASEASGLPEAALATRVTGAPSLRDADVVMATLDAVEPADERLATARVAIDDMELPACMPDDPG